MGNHYLGGDTSLLQVKITSFVPPFTHPAICISETCETPNAANVCD